MKLNKSFYLNESVTSIAVSLIGKKLCTNIDGGYTSGIIVETEAYSYLEKACHAYNNRKTMRTETLFKEGGTSYVYLCYGIHKLFNIVTNVNGTAEAVLIRAVEPLEGIEVMMQRRGVKDLHKNLTSGPGKLTQALGIRMKHNQESLVEDTIWLQEGLKLDRELIESSPRIGVGYAMDDAFLPWRFTLKNSSWVSKGNNTY